MKSTIKLVKMGILIRQLQNLKTTPSCTRTTNQMKSTIKLVKMSILERYLQNLRDDSELYQDYQSDEIHHQTSADG